MEKELADNDLHKDWYADSWAIVFNKGYQSVLEVFRGIHIKLKPFNSVFSFCNTVFNEKFRAIVHSLKVFLDASGVYEY